MALSYVIRDVLLARDCGAKPGRKIGTNSSPFVDCIICEEFSWFIFWALLDTWCSVQMLFDLSRQGMMKKFSGSWKIEPMSDGAGESDATSGSWVNFQQILEPVVIPPWPLNGYVRGVTERIIREMLADLQNECLRLSQVNSS